MVFEHLFPESVLRKKHWTAFFLAIIYSTISIVIARLIFAGNSGIVSVIFTSIFLLPYFSDLLRREAKQELNEKKFTFKHLFYDNLDMIQVYMFLFLGIYVTYLMYAFLGPFLNYDVSIVFREQLSLESIRGGAFFSFGTLSSIVMNNWWVLLACFLIALVAGDGAVFFVAWNASVWGTIFGYRAIAASMVDGSSALIALLVILVITLPHLILEGGAYVLAAIAGGVISDQIDGREELQLFVMYFFFAVAVYWILVWLMRVMVPSALLQMILTVVLALAILYAMHTILQGRRDQRVFKYNYQLFCLAILVFIVGAIIEVFVIMNATPLRDIYMNAALYSLI